MQPDPNQQKAKSDRSKKPSAGDTPRDPSAKDFVHTSEISTELFWAWYYHPDPGSEARSVWDTCFTKLCNRLAKFVKEVKIEVFPGFVVGCLHAHNYRARHKRDTVDAESIYDTTAPDHPAHKSLMIKPSNDGPVTIMEPDKIMSMWWDSGLRNCPDAPILSLILRIAPAAQPTVGPPPAAQPVSAPEPGAAPKPDEASRPPTESTGGAHCAQPADDPEEGEEEIDPPERPEPPTKRRKTTAPRRQTPCKKAVQADPPPTNAPPTPAAPPALAAPPTPAAGPVASALDTAFPEFPEEVIPAQLTMHPDVACLSCRQIKRQCTMETFKNTACHACQEGHTKCSHLDVVSTEPRLAFLLWNVTKQCEDIARFPHTSLTPRGVDVEAVPVPGWVLRQAEERGVGQRGRGRRGGNRGRQSRSVSRGDATEAVDDEGDPADRGRGSGSKKPRGRPARRATKRQPSPSSDHGTTLHPPKQAAGTSKMVGRALHSRSATAKKAGPKPSSAAQTESLRTGSVSSAPPPPTSDTSTPGPRPTDADASGVGACDDRRPADFDEGMVVDEPAPLRSSMSWARTTLRSTEVLRAPPVRAGGMFRSWLLQQGLPPILSEGPSVPPLRQVPPASAPSDPPARLPPAPILPPELPFPGAAAHTPVSVADLMAESHQKLEAARNLRPRLNAVRKKSQHICHRLDASTFSATARVDYSTDPAAIIRNCASEITQLRRSVREASEMNLEITDVSDVMVSAIENLPTVPLNKRALQDMLEYSRALIGDNMAAVARDLGDVSSSIFDGDVNDKLNDLRVKVDDLTNWVGSALQDGEEPGEYTLMWVVCKMIDRLNALSQQVEHLLQQRTPAPAPPPSVNDFDHRVETYPGQFGLTPDILRQLGSLHQPPGPTGAPVTHKVFGPQLPAGPSNLSVSAGPLSLAWGQQSISAVRSLASQLAHPWGGSSSGDSPALPLATLPTGLIASFGQTDFSPGSQRSEGTREERLGSSDQLLGNLDMTESSTGQEVTEDSQAEELDAEVAEVAQRDMTMEDDSEDTFA
ncbi:hypothetical protein C8Q80DRAFT_1273412 [Daedaleopsis nitida]|nr:hypothetical protein C8Q80DRAFT_1273412 [Daedaleopsis nitida]